LSELAFSALEWAWVASMLSLGVVFYWRSGQTQGIGTKIERAKDPWDYWFYTTLWAVIAGTAWYRAGERSWAAWNDPAPRAVQFTQHIATLLVVGILVVCGLWLAMPMRWIRRGNWWTHRAEYRRERELRVLLKQLTDDRQVRYSDGELNTLDETVDNWKIAWLEQLAGHLAAQSPPRRLQEAFDAMPHAEMEAEAEREIDELIRELDEER